MPVIGMMPIVMPMFWNTWNRSIESTPTASNRPNGSLAMRAICQMRTDM